MKRDLPDLKSLESFAQEYAFNCREGDILRLLGPMGAGKTTFCRYLVAALGGQSQAASPTYALHHQHRAQQILIVDHWDLFRVKDESELDVAGFWELLEDSRSLTLIEWPELIKDTYFPAGRRVRTLRFSAKADQRGVEAQ